MEQIYSHFPILQVVVPLILGSIVGVQLGQKLGQYLDSNQLKSLFALLLCSVAIAIGYDTFFRDQSKLINEQQVTSTDLNKYAEFSLKLSNDFPFLYGAFAIILADDLIINNPSCISQLMKTHEENQCSVIGVNEVLENEIEKYGVISIDESSSQKNSYVLKDIVEKPKSNAPSNLAVVGRYVLSSSIFKYLKTLGPSVGGEVQLTDAIKLMLNDEKVIGYLYEGTKFDCGSRHGYVNAIKHLAKELLDD